ncbi:hypothetical protein HQ584_13155 [Patescibacteria group bacterium]|nr:hypothetical protein [Patescibacteria group bacterium]
MILYSPIDGDVYGKRIQYKPKTCFIATQLAKPIPKEVKNIRNTLYKYLKIRRIKAIDANSKVTGRDFLIKIWENVIAVPLGIAIVTDELPIKTLENIFYEIGLLQAFGKETLIIKMEKVPVPSDFVRTEYIDYDRSFKFKINKYIDTFFELADHYYLMAEQLEKDPLLAIDYLERAYLIKKSKKCKEKIKEIFKKNKDSFKFYTSQKINNLLKF